MPFSNFYPLAIFFRIAYPLTFGKIPEGVDRQRSQPSDKHDQNGQDFCCIAKSCGNSGGKSRKLKALSLFQTAHPETVRPALKSPEYKTPTAITLIQQRDHCRLAERVSRDCIAECLLRCICCGRTDSLKQHITGRSLDTAPGRTRRSADHHQHNDRQKSCAGKRSQRKCRKSGGSWWIHW